MIDWIVSMLRRKPDSFADTDYLNNIEELINHQLVRSMGGYIQHGEVNCLEHSLCVSYYSYLVCRWMNLNVEPQKQTT